MIEQYECLKVFIKNTKITSLSLLMKNSQIFQEFRSMLMRKEYSINDSFLLLRSILGEGKGSTPESDDIIIGILCCFQIFKPEYDFSFLSSFPFEKFTTSKSSILLRSILRKRYPKELQKFLDLLNKSSLSSIQRRAFSSEIQKIAQIGATSGVNFLHGIFWEMDNILNESNSNLS
ncbi:oxamate carbamoyltransferase subunit AllH family protein [Candidatus Hodarchaeum mangrovi]